MSANHQFTITLPEEVAEIVRAKVSSGEYASESDFIAETIVDSALPVEALGYPSDIWLKTEIRRRYDECIAHPEVLLTADDMRRAIDEELDAIAKGE